MVGVLLTNYVTLIFGKIFEILRKIMIGYFRAWQIIGMIIGGLLLVLLFIWIYSKFKD